MKKITCTMCFATLASILAASLLGAEANSIAYPTVWMAGTTLALAITTFVVTRIRVSRNG